MNPRRPVVLVVLALLAGMLPLAVAVAPAASPTEQGAAQRGGAQGAWSQTRTLERVFRDPETGEESVVDSRRVTVKVTKTRSLRGRERIGVSWSGAHPSAARAASPFGEQGLAQEYPVVLLQCRGVDDPSAPAAQRISPETCWTSTRAQRSQSVPDRVAVWRHDLHADDAARAPKSGVDPYPAEECVDVTAFSSRITPFRAATGQTYLGCTAATMPPEAAVDSAFPPAEQAAFTSLDGDGSTQFEIRTAAENQSLGCSHQVACTLVVIPIMGLSCLDGNPECRKTGRFAAGSQNFAGDGVDAAVSPLYWWSESQWRHRFSVPLDLALPPDACSILDSRAPTAFFGSELISQAALQWAPAFCLREDRFKLQVNRMPDQAAFALVERGEAAAALVSGERESLTDAPVGYAPTAVTGFGVGYVVDRPDNAGEHSSLRLNARLLAKLLTQSYPASATGRQHPGMEQNPISMNLDPEFIALNPGLDRIERESMATIISLSESSDVITALTDYIVSDPEAKAFVAGEADPWGMRVNPSYADIELPVDEWPLLDTFIPETQNECLVANPAPYLSKVAAPVTSLRTIAEAVLDGWPNVQTRCERSAITEPWRTGRVGRQGVGTRMVLGIVSLGDAARFGLHTAALQTAKGSFVRPTDAAILAALRLGEQEHRAGAFAWTQAQVRRARNAYPGAQVVYTAARLEGVPKADAAKVAQFIRVSVTESQRRGPGNGQLPDGYVPLQASGPTARYRAAALEVADLVAAQAGLPEDARPGRPGDRGRGDGPPGAGGAGDGGGGAGTVSQDEVLEDTGDAGAPGGLPSLGSGGDVVLTTPVSSGLAGGLLPVLLLVILLAGLASAALQVGARVRRRP